MKKVVLSLMLLMSHSYASADLESGPIIEEYGCDVDDGLVDDDSFISLEELQKEAAELKEILEKILIDLQVEQEYFRRMKLDVNIRLEYEECGCCDMVATLKGE